MPALKSSQTSETAAAAVLRSCLDQIDAGRGAILASDDPEGPHQLRVGLRRLRAALTFFRPAIDSPAARALGEEARWLGREAGRTRDFDVVTKRLGALLGDGPGAPHPLVAALRSAAGRRRTALRALLGGDRVLGFRDDLGAFVDRRGWLVPEDFGQTSRLARPLGQLARRSLRRRWKRTSAAADHIGRQTAEERHALRKELKKLRYAFEFAAPLYDRHEARAFLKRLKKLQDVFGDFNDAIVTRRVAAEAAEDLPAGEDDTRALDRAFEDLDRRAAAAYEAAGHRWKKLAGTPRPWE